MAGKVPISELTLGKPFVEPVPVKIEVPDIVKAGSVVIKWLAPRETTMELPLLSLMVAACRSATGSGQKFDVLGVTVKSISELLAVILFEIFVPAVESKVGGRAGP